MRRMRANTLFYHIAKIFIAIVVTASFCLAAASCGKANYLFPKQTADLALFKKSDDARASHLRTDSREVFTLIEMNGSRHTFHSSQCKTVVKNGCINDKNTIFLKLRI